MNKSQVTSLDDAVTIGLRVFRDRYPEGEIPVSIEAEMNLSAQPGYEQHRVLVSLSIQGEKEQWVFFECAVSRESGDAHIITCRSVCELRGLALAIADHP
jgi:hypothetical protein